MSIGYYEFRYLSKAFEVILAPWCGIMHTKKADDKK
jgi:hypothetical protein